MQRGNSLLGSEAWAVAEPTSTLLRSRGHSKGEGDSRKLESSHPSLKVNHRRRKMAIRSDGRMLVSTSETPPRRAPGNFERQTGSIRAGRK